MQQKISLKILPQQAADATVIKTLIADATGKKLSAITGFDIQKKSLD